MELGNFCLNGSFYINNQLYSVSLSSILRWDLISTDHQSLSASHHQTQRLQFSASRTGSVEKNGTEETSVTLVKVEDKHLNRVYAGSHEVRLKHFDKFRHTEGYSVDLHDIIAVQSGDFASTNQLKHPSGFSICFVRRATKHRWRVNKVYFQTKDPHDIQEWVDKIRTLIDKPELQRPKSLMVFINPVGGKKKAPEIYQHKVAAYFDLAGVKTNVIMTERADHARDMIIECDMSNVDGIVSVGGDGMFTEVLHGLMERTYKQHGTPYPPAGKPLLHPSMKLGIIPAGSTDTVSWSLQGCGDPTTAALHIIVGDTLPMDIGTLHHGDKFIKYHVSLLAYGFYGDVLIDSELHRWMGPRRYDWAGAKKFLSHRSYEGEFSYIPSANTSSHPRDGVTCKVGCDVCSASTQFVNLDKPLDISSVNCEQHEWKKVHGRFLAINSFLISCRCRFSEDGPSPFAHLGDGCYDVVVISDCSRSNYFKHLYRCTQPGKDQFALPHVEVFRVKAFKFRPMEKDCDDTINPTNQNTLKSTSSQHSTWNCDGEIVEQPGIDVVAHRHVVKMFARGIENEILPTTSTTSSCFNPQEKH